MPADKYDEMARECVASKLNAASRGAEFWVAGHGVQWSALENALTRDILALLRREVEAAEKREREACAKECERVWREAPNDRPHYRQNAIADGCTESAAAIRARSEAETERDACAAILDEHADNMQREAELERVCRKGELARVLRAVSVGIRASAAAIRARKESSNG